MNKAQAGKKVVKKPVKKRTPHPNDDYKDMVDPATGKKGTMGGEGTTPPFTRKERSKMPRVGNMGSAKNGKSFPDLNKDGKITRADILKGRGVIAKKGATVKKAQNGTAIKQQKWKKDHDSKIKGVKGMSENEKVKKGITKLVPLASQIKANVMPPKPPKKKMGGSMKKCKYGCK
jgi:hypothetical protein